jgi:hypothetical protein
LVRPQAKADGRFRPTIAIQFVAELHFGIFGILLGFENMPIGEQEFLGNHESGGESNILVADADGNPAHLFGCIAQQIHKIAVDGVVVPDGPFECEVCGFGPQFVEQLSAFDQILRIAQQIVVDGFRGDIGEVGFFTILIEFLIDSFFLEKGIPVSGFVELIT